jgi:hypothetical protein
MKGTLKATLCALALLPSASMAMDFDFDSAADVCSTYARMVEFTAMAIDPYTGKVVNDSSVQVAKGYGKRLGYDGRTVDNLIKSFQKNKDEIPSVGNDSFMMSFTQSCSMQPDKYVPGYDYIKKHNKNPYAEL